MTIRVGLPSFLFLALATAPTVVVAQAHAPRVEAAVQVAVHRWSDLDRANTGFGGRVSFDLSRWATVEGEVSYYPNDDVQVPPSSTPSLLAVAYSRTRTEGFFGVKVGLRRERLGVFAKVRPGFSRMTDQGVNCVGDDCARVLMLLAVPDYRTEFALDFGGVFEFYPSSRIVARVDLGDTMVRHRSSATPPCQECTTHNLSSRFGVGVRF